MPIQFKDMASHGTKTAQSNPSIESEWLWTWSGLSFGYRLKDSLFTHDGMEIGRFSGTEVYGPDGHYLGELRVSDDGKRLITNIYKRSRTVPAFISTPGRAYKRLGDRAAEALYCGHEDFPAPENAIQLGFKVSC